MNQQIVLARLNEALRLPARLPLAYRVQNAQYKMLRRAIEDIVADLEQAIGKEAEESAP